jgi:6-phosphogluconolactonase (cycloisomerase 2 family)
MRFTKFGKALSMGALSAGLVFGVTSCVQSYTVGFLYVTGTVTASTGSNGIISGYKIDHNTGKLTAINGLPVSSGGANPVRAVLALGSRFVYVLNRGASAAGSGNCYGTSTNECENANITEFAVGGNGVLTAQETFYTQGSNPFRMTLDSTGNYLLVLDHDAPSTALCSAMFSMTTCGDITVFKIDSTTGRLTLVENTAESSSTASTVTYFPVPGDPVDFVLAGSTLLTLYGPPAIPNAYPYTGGTTVWPYTYSSGNGQLTVTSSGSQVLNTTQVPVTDARALVYSSSVLYVLDNDSGSTTYNNATTSYNSKIIPYQLSNNTLSIEPSGIIPDSPTLGNPITLMVDAKSKYLYVANQGNQVTGNNPESGIAAYFITTSPSYQTSFVSGQPFGSGSGPQCIVEDPSDQFVFEVNQYDSTITGRVLDPDSGALNDMRSTETYTLDGPPTWCLVDGRTS